MKPIGEKLLGIFREEHHEHSKQIRLLIDRIRQAENPGQDLDEAFRRAHSLKGAARAVDIGEIESLGHRLETLFARVRRGELRIDASVAEVVHDALDCSEDILANLAGRGAFPATPEVLAAIDRLLAAAPLVESSPPGGQAGGETPLTPGPPGGERGRAAGRLELPATDTAGAPKAEASEAVLHEDAGAGHAERGEASVRLRAAQVSRLLRTCDQLLGAAPRQESLVRGARELARELEDLTDAWGRLRTICAPQFHRLAADPEFKRFGRLLDGFERRLRQAPGQARRRLLEQKRSAAAARQLASQLRLDVWTARLTTAESVFDGFGNMVRSLARGENKPVRFRTAGLDTEADLKVLQALRDPVMHLLRNAVSHGIESSAEREKSGKARVGQVTLALDAAAGWLTLRVNDDGRGIDFAQVASEARRRGLLPEQSDLAGQEAKLRQILFAPGFSTAPSVTEIAGRGMGLSVVEQSVRRLQGEVETHSQPGRGTTVTIRVPLSVLMQRVLLVSAGARVFALPLQWVERVSRGTSERLETIADQPHVRAGGQSIRAVSLAASLGLPLQSAWQREPFVVVRNSEKRVAFFVDELLEQRDAFVKDLNIPEAHGTLAAGGVMLESGAVAVVLNVPELLRASESAAQPTPAEPPAPASEERKPRILLADDSITTRALERGILEVHGYDVLVAVDGAEALQMLKSQGADLVVSDVQMPRMDGFGLLQAMKNDNRLARIPVIMLTSMESREDQEKGLALGADAYIVKRKFDQRELLETIRQIL